MILPGVQNLTETKANFTVSCQAETKDDLRKEKP